MALNNSISWAGTNIRGLSRVLAIEATAQLQIVGGVVPGRYQKILVKFDFILVEGSGEPGAEDLVS
jgi:hypothetical protein